MIDIIQYIEKIRAKPLHLRKRFAFIVSFAITFVIFSGWIASYGINSPTNIITDKGTKIDGPISSLTASVGSVFDNIKSVFFSTNKFEYSAKNSIEIVPNP